MHRQWVSGSRKYPLRKVYKLYFLVLSTEEESVPKKPRKMKTGKNWAMFKPNGRAGLYFDLVENLVPPEVCPKIENLLFYVKEKNKS